MRNARRSRSSFEYRQSGKRAPRLTIEKIAEGQDYLDARELRRANVFGDGWRSFRPSLRWPSIVKITAARYQIQLELENQVRPQQIRVSWTRCHLGGFRPWLHRLCGQRVARLFKGTGGYYCRPCLGNPMYASQPKSSQGRRHFQACKLRLRLGGVASISAPFPERPRGMHKKTYLRLRRRAERLEFGLAARLRSKPADYPSLIYHQSA